MMATGNYNTKRKQVYFKAFDNLSLLESALKRIQKEHEAHLQLAILGKVSLFSQDTGISLCQDEASVKATSIKLYWKAFLGKTTKFGTFYNQQVEAIFIVGFLVSTFLHKINGKSLAALSSGPYGIFRGIGASEIQATAYLKQLNSGKYLLILRGYDDELQELDAILNNSMDD